MHETFTPATDGLVSEPRVAAFVGSGTDYYRREFERLGRATGYVTSFNPAAAALGPLWLAVRRLWGWFWPFLILETFAIVQLCRGLFADLGAEESARALRLAKNAVSRRAEAQEALASGASNAGALAESARALEAASQEAFAVAEAAAAAGTGARAGGRRAARIHEARAGAGRKPCAVEAVLQVVLEFVAARGAEPLVRCRDDGLPRRRLRLQCLSVLVRRGPRMARELSLEQSVAPRRGIGHRRGIPVDDGILGRAVHQHHPGHSTPARWHGDPAGRHPVAGGCGRHRAPCVQGGRRPGRGVHRGLARLPRNSGFLGAKHDDGGAAGHRRVAVPGRGNPAGDLVRTPAARPCSGAPCPWT